jgi:hypothetical protein
MLLQHPEDLRAVAPVSTNYQGRWMSPENFSSAPERVNLPLKVLRVEALPEAFAGQMSAAMETAEAHGYRNVSMTIIPGKPHGPLADEVLHYFASLLGM